MASKPTKQKNLRMDEDETFETGEAVQIPDGTHRGIIEDVWGEQTPQGYKYVQLGIKLDSFPDANIRYGCPIPKDEKPITDKSKLGQLLLTFGLGVGSGEAYSIRQIREALSGKKIACIMMNEPSSKNENISFANIVEGSIKPL